VRTAAPKALWGTADIGDPKQSSEALGSEQTVGQVLFGVQITAHQFVPDFTQTVLLQTLLYNATDPVVVTLANTALPAPIQVSHKDVASTISAAKAQRAAVLAAMQARGHGVGLRPAAIHVSQLAAGHGRLLDSPIEQEIA
jgi:hypothetical protein